MGQRQIEEALVASMDQVRTLLEAESLYVRRLPVGDLAPHEARMVGEVHQRIRAARDYADATIRRLIDKLDPYGDIYAFQPAEPIELTPLGIIPRTSGFSNYQDNATVQNVPANALTVVENNRLSVMETQKPSDVPTFFRDQRIRVTEGDAVAIRVQATVHASDPANIASMGQIGLSINGQTVIFPEQIIFNGYNTPVAVSYATTAYAGRTWEQNGAAVVIQADGPVQITARTLLVTRLHKARG